MTSVVTEGCVKCGACMDICPVSAIEDGDTQMVVNPEVCVDCGMCITECPQGIIETSDKADEKWIAFNKEKTQL